MSDSILRTKSKEFAKNVVFLCRTLKQKGVETSVGANIHEAQISMKRNMRKAVRILF
ncbi:MAG: hypothetical protein IJX39_07390 [Clostridia bacterium]|nr:hypothetical protein [Clostridia bacterium]